MADFNNVDVIKSHIQNNNTRLYTQLPAVVVSFDPDNNFVDATLLVADSIRSGNTIQAGKVINVPVLFPSGGTFKQGFKLEVGDNVLLNFCMRSLDNYHLSDGTSVTESEYRRYHDMSDCFATVGAFPKAYPVVSEEFKGYSYILDDNTSIVFNKDSDGLIITSDKDITFNTVGGKLTVNGDLEIEGELVVSGSIQAEDVIVPLSTDPTNTPILSLKGHTHAALGSPPIPTS